MYRAKYLAAPVGVLTRSSVVLPVSVSLIFVVVTLLAAYPGMMNPDSVQQLYAARHLSDVNDWHSPIILVFWSFFTPWSRSPENKLFVQIALCTIAIYRYTHAAVTILGPRPSPLQMGVLAIPVCVFLPMLTVLAGFVGTDALMTCSLAAASSILCNAQLEGRMLRAFENVAIGILLLFGGFCRVNSFAALWPLFGWWFLRAFPRKTSDRIGLRHAGAGALGVISAIGLVACMPWVNHTLLGAKDARAISSLQIFDLAGITRQTGENQFAPLLPADSEFNERRISTCYNPALWDPYDTGDWSTDWPDPASHDCGGMRRILVERGLFGSPLLQRTWLNAVWQHPAAYAGHRFAHFAASLKLYAHSYAAFYSVPFIDPQGVMNTNPVPTSTAATPGSYWASQHLALLEGVDLWNPNAFTRWYFRLVHVIVGLLVFGPAEWLLFACLAFVWATHKLSRTDHAVAGIVWPLSMSAMSYTAGFAIVGVGFGTRYHMWLYLVCAMTAPLLCASALARAKHKTTVISSEAPLGKTLAAKTT